MSKDSWKSLVQVHPAANIFPLMGDEEYQDLKDAIWERGQQMSIVFLGGKLIDGRNRYRACVDLGIEPECREATIEDIPDPAQYVLDLNLHRRQLSTSQRAMVGVRIKEYYDSEAKGRKSGQSDRLKKGAVPAPGKIAISGKTLKKVPSPPSEGTSRDIVGKVVGVSGRTIEQAAKVVELGSRKLTEAVQSGDLKVSSAAALAEAVPDKREQDKIVKMGPAAVRESISEAKKPNRTPEEQTAILRSKLLKTIEAGFRACDDLHNDSPNEAAHERVLAGLQKCHKAVWGGK